MREEDLWNGEMVGVVVNGKKVVMANIAGAVRAYPDRCLHLGVELSRGRLVGQVLTCCAHGWQYDLLTGAGVNPANVALVCYPVRVEEGEIWVDVDA
jgi:toluene monooxygenase system ferredoxin subunit